MTSISRGIRQARIIAIPLTKPRTLDKIPTKGHQALTYYQFQFESKKPQPETKKASNGSRWLPEGGLAKWASTKAASTWAGFGKAEGGWKLKLFQAGERLVDRMEFEELALKSIDPSMGPSLSKPSENDATKELEQEKKESHHIPLIYPPSINTGPATLNELRALVEHRTPRHRRGFLVWALIAPLTAPFMIIPIIPNIPFFFCVWRSWSHYKAYRASHYLESLLVEGVVVPEPKEELDAVYKEFSPRAIEASEPHNSQSNGQQTEPKEQTTSRSEHHNILLTRDAVSPIVNLFGLKLDSTADLLRSIEQARVRVSTGRAGL